MSSLFHSLVVCGAGLTLVSCGGRSEGNPQESEPTRGGGSSEGGTSSGSSKAGSVSDGGSLVITPTGGSNTAGSLSLSVGGTAPVTKPGPLLPGSEGQWVCDGELKGCTAGGFEGKETYGFHISAACGADPMRPKSSDDCTGEAKLSCSIGFFEDQAVLSTASVGHPRSIRAAPVPRPATAAMAREGRITAPSFSRTSRAVTILAPAACRPCLARPNFAGLAK